MRFEQVFSDIFLHSSVFTGSYSWTIFGDRRIIRSGCHIFSIGFKSRFIEGHGRTVIFFFLKPCSHCWNHRLRSRFYAYSCRFLSRILIWILDFIIPVIVINFSAPNLSKKKKNLKKKKKIKISTCFQFLMLTQFFEGVGGIKSLPSLLQMSLHHYVEK